MGGRFIFGIVIFRAKEIGGSIKRGLIFWGIYTSKLKGRNERNERNIYKGINKGYKVGVKCGLSIGKTKARLRKSYFEGLNIVGPKGF